MQRSPLPPDDIILIITAIRDVGADLAAAEADASIDDAMKNSRQWHVAAQACIADLPAEVLS